MLENFADVEYIHLIRSVSACGQKVNARNGACKRLCFRKLTFTDTPLIAVRRTAWKNALREWEWFMSGSSDIKDLHPSVQHWWKPWADERGNVAYNYSHQFRHFAYRFDDLHEYETDQIHYLIEGLKNHPNSRRNCITTWNTEEMTSPHCKITNCHSTVTQVFVDDQNKAHLGMYQRSADVICGLPHNLIQYWAFLLWLSHRSGRLPGTFTWIGGDVHIYDAHKPIVEKILNSPCPRQQPNLIYTPTSEEFKADDFTLDGEYTPLIEDRAEMVV